MGSGPGQVARYLHGAGLTVFGLDLAPRMVAIARKLNPNLSFEVGNMAKLDLPDRSLAGITAFYAIANIPNESLPFIFREMERVLQPEGLLLLAFHLGDDTVYVDELWGTKISLDFFLFSPSAIRNHLEAAGFELEEVIVRGPYAPDVQHQSQRAYLLARKSRCTQKRQRM